MRNLLATLLLFFVFFAGAQTLSPGNYTSEDGNYTVAIQHDGNNIRLTSPVKVEEYKASGGTTYYHVDPRYSNYYLRVAGTKKYYTGKSGGSEFLFTYSGEAPANGLALGIDNCPLYDKYLQLAQGDAGNVQAWAFCGAAAFAKCTYNEEGTKEYLESIIRSLKSIMDDATTCPCVDAITTAEWNSVSID